MNLNENPDIISNPAIITEMVGKGFLLLIKNSNKELVNIKNISELIKDIESEKTKKIFGLIDKYKASVDDEIKVYKEFLNLLDKLESTYKVEFEIKKEILEESNELLEQI